MVITLIEEGPGMTRKLQHILVIDVCRAEREHTVSILAKAGYEVVETVSEIQCRDSLEREIPALILFDPYIPDGDGFHLLTEIRERHSADVLPIIVMSNKSNDQMVVRALTSGANDYVHKGLDATTFLARIYNHISLSQMRRQVDEQRNKLNEVLSIQRVLANFAPEALFVENKDGLIVFRNDTLDRLCRGVAPQSTKEALRLIFPIELASTLESLVRKSGLTGSFEEEFHWKTPQKRCVRVRSCPAIASPKADLRMWGFCDVTEARISENQVRAERQLHSVAQFVHGITFHMEELLDTITEASQALRKITPPQSPVMEFFNLINASVESGRRLSEKTKLAVGHAAPSLLDGEDVVQVLHVLTEAARIQVGERISFMLELDQVLPRVPLSLRSLSGIFGNILANAIDAISGTGEVVVSAHADMVSGTILVAFEDSGDGMDQSALQRVGEPFYSTKISPTDYIGDGKVPKGLGMWSARHLAEAHGGCLSVTSRQGDGTKIVVELPMLRHSVANSVQSASPL